MKKILSLLLTVAMLYGLMSTQAFAVDLADDSDYETIPQSKSEWGTDYDAAESFSITRFAGVPVGQLTGTSTVKNVSVSGSITQLALKGTTCLGSVGGVAGQVPAGSSASIQNCTSSVSLTTSGSNVGGILGSGVGSAAIADCTNTGAIQGGESTDGIAGRVYAKPTVTECINSGIVSGADSIGALLVLSCLMERMTALF